MPEELPIYSADTSSWIDLDRQYNIEFFPSLWEALARLARAGRLITSEVALDEVDDEWLRNWLKATPGLVQGVDPVQEGHVARIMAAYPDLVDPDKTREDADPFVIALALAEAAGLLGSIRPSYVLSSEKARKGSNARHKIPDVCKALGIGHASLAEFFRQEGWAFQLVERAAG